MDKTYETRWKTSMSAMKAALVNWSKDMIANGLSAREVEDMEKLHKYWLVLKTAPNTACNGWLVFIDIFEFFLALSFSSSRILSTTAPAQVT